MTLLSVFYVIGIIFGIAFLFLNISAFFGGDHGALDHDISFDHGDISGHDGINDTDADGSGFFGEALTLRSLINFLTFFAWTGIFGLERGWGTISTIIIATLIGLVFTVLFASIMFGLKKLQSAPEPLGENDFVGKQAIVYLVIPGGDKKGKIQLIVRESYLTVDALSTDGQKIETNSQVKITDFISDNLVKVTKV